MIACPKCGSKNTTQTSLDKCVCQDCFNVFPHSVQKQKSTKKNYLSTQNFIFPFFLGGIAVLFLTLIVSRFFSTTNNQNVSNNKQPIPAVEENPKSSTAQSSSPPPEIKVSYQETINAVNQLDAFRAKLDIGLNMISYSEELGNVNVAVESAIRENPSSDNAAKFRKIIDTYKAALELWHCELETNFDTQCWCQNDAYEQTIFILYPDIAAKVTPHKDIFDSGGYQYLVDHKKVMQLLWTSAEIETSHISKTP